MVKAFNTRVIVASAVVIIVAAGVLLSMGRVPFCECGTIKLWTSETVSSENSQQFADPYSFTHIIHGLAFYLLLRIFASRLPVGVRGVIAVAIEAFWEVIENTDFVINRYREETLSLDYYGDSVLNSVGDIIFTGIGFLIAARFPIWFSIAILVAIELLLLYFIRDNLTLNIVMLIRPIEAIKVWQLQ